MNSEHLDAQYIYKEYAGYIFKIPRNKDLKYQSSELQEYYYWSIAELCYNKLVSDFERPSIANRLLSITGQTTITDTINSTNTNQSLPKNRFVIFNDIKKEVKHKIIATALKSIYGFNNNNSQIEQATTTTNNFQYMEIVKI